MYDNPRCKAIKLADYLQSLGYTPVKQQGKNQKTTAIEETDASFTGKH